MRQDPNQKVTRIHLTKNAYLYIRQSTLQQVVEHTESARRQYDLQERALALGWDKEQINVVDSDQGQSGRTADRIGFQKLVAEVSLGRVGLVMGLEVSRLARNSADWHRLLEICALSDTLILDEDGLYNPNHFNDRLLLGLKGTMSEAELHMIRARLQGGLLSKARRGELKVRLPVGFVYDETSQVVLDPDVQVREAIRLFFETFRRIGTALGTARAFQQQNLDFPRRLVQGPRSQIVWKPLDVASALRMLRNPRYAGTFFYGRTRQRRHPDGRWIRQYNDPENWVALIPDAHPGYITQQQYEQNLRQLRENAQAIGADRRSPPREGAALLQGMVMCGKCGRPMTVHYHHRQGRLIPSYVCAQKIGPSCQILHGEDIDKALGELLVESLSPVTLEISLAVQQELQQRFEQAEQLRQKQVERARYEADRARLRFLQVDPNNRLVAATLEADWNEKLRLLHAAQEEFERQREEDRQRLSEDQKSKILALATDLPRLWNDSQTPTRERKRMLRLMVEDVTLLRQENFTVHVRFKGGATKTLALPAALNAWQLRKTSPQLVAEVDQLLDHHTEGEICQLFNDKGLVTGTGQPFTIARVSSLRRAYGLKRRYHRLRDAGCLSMTELAAKLHVGQEKLECWQAQGLLKLKAHHFDSRCCLYEVLSFDPSKSGPRSLVQAPNNPTE